MKSASKTVGGSRKIHGWFRIKVVKGVDVEEIKQKVVEAVKATHNDFTEPEVWYKGVSVVMGRNCIRAKGFIVCIESGHVEPFDCEDLGDALTLRRIAEEAGDKESVEWLEGEIRGLRKKCWSADFKLASIEPIEKGDDVEELIREFRQSGRRKVAFTVWFSTKFYEVEIESKLARIKKALMQVYHGTGYLGQYQGLNIHITDPQCVVFRGLKVCEASGSVEPVRCLELERKKEAGERLTSDERYELRWCWGSPLLLISVEPA